MFDYKVILNLLGDLYDASTDVEKWQPFLEKLAAVFDAKASQIGHHNLKYEKLTFNLMHGIEFDPVKAKRYEELLSGDPQVSYGYENPEKPYTPRMFMSEDQIHQTPMYEEMMVPSGIEYTMCVTMLDGPESASFLILGRSIDQEPFSREDRDFLSELVPHIRRALRLHKNFSVLDFHRAVTFGTLDQFAMGIFIIDQNRKLIFGNDAANHLVEEGDGIRLFNDNIVLESIGDTNKLNQAIANQVHNAFAGQTSPCIAIRAERPSGSQAYSIVVSNL
ncbi:MAG: hypothetical protein HN884_08025, partial [Rhodospirillaceae bacterium]|nr:hypothetical protein [Rhodospirillaceae bacterium]